MKPWIQYALAFLLLVHGFIYVRVGSMLPDPINEWTGTSWLLGHAVSDPHLGTLAVGLHVFAGMALIACAATIGVPWIVPGWWRPLAMIGGALGVAGFAVFWDGQTRLLVEEGALGALISLAVLVGAIFFHSHSGDRHDEQEHIGVDRGHADPARARGAGQRV